MIGVKGQKQPLENLDEKKDQEEQPLLEYAPERARQVADALHTYGYEVQLCADDPGPTAAALQESVSSVHNSGPGFMVVHLLTHGTPDETNGVYPVGGDGRQTEDDVESWLKRIEKADPDGTPLVLLLLDMCYSGRAVRLNWQPLMSVERRRTWVIAASGPQERAYDGWLSRAVTEVLGNYQDGVLRVDASLPHVPIRGFLRQVRLRIERYVAEGSGEKQRLHTPLTSLDIDDTDLAHLRFFPNPRYGKEHPAWTGPQEATASAEPSAVPDPALTALLNEALDPRHFAGRASGTEAVSNNVEDGFFCGREAEARQLASWLRGDGTALRVVTGKPGVGKSALLGVLVCAAHPRMRDETTRLWRQLKAPPPKLPHPYLAVVHARQRSVTEVLDAIVRQWNLTPSADRTAKGIADILAARESAPTLVIDALDEAREPEELMNELLMLIDRRRPDGQSVCRLLVGVRAEHRFRPLLRKARRMDGRLDLDRVPRRRLRADLQKYIGQLLKTSSPYESAANEALADELAQGIASALTPLRGVEVGEFLAAALYVRQILDRPVPATPREARKLGAAVPNQMLDLLDLDLSQRQEEPWLRAVLTVLAHAQGNGMPEEIIRAAAGLFRPGDDTNVPSMDEIRSCLEAGRFYLRRDVDKEGNTRYRLFHQSLADQMYTEAGARAVWRRLHAEAGRWSTTNPYLLEFAGHHALAAGELKTLLADPEFLVHADPLTLNPLLASQDDEMRFAQLYRQTSLQRFSRPRQRREVLAVAAARGSHSNLRNALTRGANWRPRKVATAPHREYLDVIPGFMGGDGAISGPHRFETASKDDLVFQAIATMTVRERPMVAALAGDLHVHFRDVHKGPPHGFDSVRSDSVYLTNMLCCAAVGDGIVVLAGGPKSPLSLWRIRKPGRTLDIRRPERMLDPGSIAPLTEVTLSYMEDRPVVIVCGGGRAKEHRGEGMVGCFDLETLKPLGQPLKGHHGPVNAVASVTLGRHAHLVTAGSDGAVRLWNLTTGTTVHTFHGHEGPVESVKMLPIHGRPHALTGGSDGTIRLWDLTQFSDAGTFQSHKGGVRHIVPVLLQKRPHAVSTGNDNTVRIRDLETGLETDSFTLPAAPASMAVTTDGEILLALGKHIVALKAATGRPRPQPIDPVRFP
ncbi:hypothetical protein [Streptomyces sp. NPDC050388]|uniref:hypothetical protein n=1 Tax=Streptomyces sp. NPDC050388 TaxID=3155781 RepID=UPI00343E1D93